MWLSFFDKKRDVPRLHGVDRTRSALGDSIGNSKPAWVVALVLKPRPGRAWQETFEDVAWRVAAEGRLVFEYCLDPGTTRSYFGHVKPDFWAGVRRALRRSIRRQTPVVLSVTCPPSEIHVRRAHLEAQRLIATVNEVYRTNEGERIKQEHKRAEDVARLSRSLRDLERTRRRERGESWLSGLGRSRASHAPAMVESSETKTRIPAEAGSSRRAGRADGRLTGSRL
jgi:hypothetical protein